VHAIRIGRRGFAVLAGLSGALGPGLFVRRWGTGRPLVLLHGLLASGEMFAPIAAAWAYEYHLIVPDLRGRGRSAHLPGPYSIPQLASDVVDVLNEIGVQRANVLGYSLGGVVAQQLARDHPERVDRLILACTCACHRITRRERINSKFASGLLSSLGAGGIARALLGGGGGPPLPPTHAAALRRMLRVNTRRRAVAAHRAMLKFDSRKWLSDISAPTLVVCGSADTFVPEWHSQLLALGIPNAELARVKGAGHTLLWTHTAQLSHIVDAWLSRNHRRDQRVRVPAPRMTPARHNVWRQNAR
jgi:pimeloyl-ACP methyl ester carboxylesterase